jgi:L-arabinonolactonase
VTTPSLRLPLPGRDLIGESPVWDPREGALYWVDIRGQRVQRWTGGDDPVAQWSTPQMVGSIALAAPGRLLLALEHGFSWLALDSGVVTPLAQVHHPRPPMRLNDGRTDREGRFVCGSMVLHRRDPEGSLYRLEHDGRVTMLLNGGIAVANATCFSPDGRTLYHADSLAGVIRAWDYAPDGSLSNERVFADTRRDGSAPDGATVDAQGCVWVALVLSAQLACYAPDGRLLRRLDVPVPHPTCPCFGGPGLGTMYLSSLRDGGNALRSDEPAAGALVEITGLGVRGLPEVPYRFDE